MITSMVSAKVAASPWNAPVTDGVQSHWILRLPNSVALPVT
jgi:hypothetical protein